MSQTPLLDDDFTGATENLDPKVKKCLADYKKLQAEFQALFQYQERVQKETEYVKAQSRKGKQVTTVPPTKVGDKPMPILSAVEKMKKKSIIVTPYLDSQIVEDIYKGVGIAMPQNKVEDDDGIEEDIQPDF